jgi:hypothetical protein
MEGLVVPQGCNPAENASKLRRARFGMIFAYGEETSPPP